MVNIAKHYEHTPPPGFVYFKFGQPLGFRRRYIGYVREGVLEEIQWKTKEVFSEFIYEDAKRRVRYLHLTVSEEEWQAEEKRGFHDSLQSSLSPKERELKKYRRKLLRVLKDRKRVLMREWKLKQNGWI